MMQTKHRIVTFDFITNWFLFQKATLWCSMKRRFHFRMTGSGENLFCEAGKQISALQAAIC